MKSGRRRKNGFAIFLSELRQWCCFGISGTPESGKAKMRKGISCVLVLGVMLHVTGCGIRNLDREEVMGFLDNLAGEIASGQITQDRDLIGERLYAEDKYTGRYLAECGGETGRDVVFGGGSVESRKLYLCGYMVTYSGKAVVRIRMNEDVVELEPDEEGYFETSLNLEGGGNYIMVKYENFCGTVEVTSGYSRAAD